MPLGRLRASWVRQVEAYPKQVSFICSVGATDVPNTAEGAIPGQDIPDCYTWIVEKTFIFHILVRPERLHIVLWSQLIGRSR